MDEKQRWIVVDDRDACLCKEKMIAQVRIIFKRAQYNVRETPEQVHKEMLASLKFLRWPAEVWLS